MEYSTVINLPTSDFQKIIRDMNGISDRIEIKSVGNDLIFSCEGNFAQSRIYRSESDGYMEFIQKPDASVIIRPDFAIIGRISKIENLFAEKIAHMNAVFQNIQLAAVCGGNADRWAVPAKALSNLLAAAGGLVRRGNAHISQAPVRKAKPFIIKHRAAIIRRALALGKFAGKPCAVPACICAC